MATGIGDALREARRAERRSLSDAAAETRIRETYLAALEEEDFTALGGDVYVKGFLRSYAKFLGLDPDPLVEAYRDEYERYDEPSPLGPSSRPALPGPSERPPPAVLWGAAAAVLLLVVLFVGMRSGDDTVDLADSPPQSAPTAPATPSPDDGPDDGAPDDGAPDDDPTDDDPTDDVDPDETAEDDDPDDLPRSGELDDIEATVNLDGGESWIRVTVDDVVQIEGLQTSGASFDYSASESFRIRIGDASAATLEVNGTDQGSLGSSGEVVEILCEAGSSACEVTERL